MTLATPGTQTTLLVLANGHLPLVFQWRLNGAPILYATNSVLAFASVRATDFGAYSVVVSNAIGAVVSQIGVLQGPPPRPNSPGSKLRAGSS